MPKRDLALSYTDQMQKKSSGKITYINPEATDSQMIEFKNKLQELTYDTITKTQVVDTTDLTTKSSRNITISTTISGVTIDGLNVTIPSAAFRENYNWQVDLTVTGTGVGSATYSITPPALSAASNANIVGLYLGANSVSEAILYVEAEDGTNQDLMLGEYKVLVLGGDNYYDEVITVTITE